MNYYCEYHTHSEYIGSKFCKKEGQCMGCEMYQSGEFEHHYPVPAKRNLKVRNDLVMLYLFYLHGW